MLIIYGLKTAQQSMRYPPRMSSTVRNEIQHEKGLN